MIQLIDYGAGNLQSIKNALTKLDSKFEVISSPKDIKANSKIIFAGVGAAGTAMQSLKKSGFDKALPKIENPFLGICLGMQLLFDYSEENDTKCLGIVAGDVRRFPVGITTPQIGWNKAELDSQTPLFKDVGNNSYFYFVNSYYAKPTNNNSIAQTEYGITFCSAVAKDNYYGVQFHPEKSGETAQKILLNFIDLC